MAKRKTYMGYIWGWKNLAVIEDGSLVSPIARRLSGNGNPNPHLRATAFAHGPGFSWTHEPQRAVCGRFGSDPLPSKSVHNGSVNNGFAAAFSENHPHTCPNALCSCGFYAWDSLSDMCEQWTPSGMSVSPPTLQHELEYLRAINNGADSTRVNDDSGIDMRVALQCQVSFDSILARVKAWGLIVRGEWGFRAQYMQIDSLHIRDLPEHHSEEEKNFFESFASKYQRALWNKRCMETYSKHVPVHVTHDAYELYGVRGNPNWKAAAAYFRSFETEEARIEIPPSELTAEDYAEYSGLLNSESENGGGTR